MSVVLPRRGAVLSMAALAALVFVGACSSQPAAETPAPAPTPPAGDFSRDARVGLSAGLFDAGEYTSNLKVVGKAVSPKGFLGITNSDLAFTGNYVIQGNYNGPVVWDISNPAKPSWSWPTNARRRRTTCRCTRT
jgi:hypothetical protein